MFAQVFVAVCMTALLLLWQIIQRLFLTPLRKVPGPFLARITGYWLILVDMCGNRTTTLHRLHKQYGPTVRIGPNEVSFSNPEAVKEIYSQQTDFMKSHFYDAVGKPVPGIFSMRNRAEHGQRRRLLSHAFSQSNLLNTEPLIRHQIQRLVARLDQHSGRASDMLLLFRLLAFDIIGELFLGQSFGGLESTSMPAFLVDMDNTFMLAGVQANFPAFHFLLRCIPLPSLKHFLGSRSRLTGYGETAFNNYVLQHGRDSGRKDLLTKILAPTNSKEALSDFEVHTEIGNLVFAGTDTTSTTLTYLFWELSCHSEWQERLYVELSAQEPWDKGIPRYKDVSDLPVLSAIISEALRLHPAAPASLPRETPVGGRILNGYTMPPKTVVSSQCYTTQRDPEVFPNPGAFLPDRWIDKKNYRSDTKVLFMPFSSGPRACLGKSLAMMELSLITATLVRSFQVKPSPATTADSMSMKDHFLVLPKGGACDLVFESRDC